MLKYFILCNILFAPFFSYAKTIPALPAIHAFTPFASAAEFSSGKSYGLDEKGILFYDYGGRYNNLGKFNNPTFIAAYANALYRDYLLGDLQARTKFMKQVDYLMSTAKEDAIGLYWPLPFENKHYLAPNDWYSGMTSGRVLGVLVRAHAITLDDMYLNAARKVFDKLSQKRESGGMTTYCKDGAAWLEEVAYPGSKSFKVLNGHIFGLAGIYDYAKYTGSKEINSYLLKGIAAVKNGLSTFDAGYLSYYSEANPIKENRSFAERGGYNVIHIQQLLWLYEITSDVEFLKKALAFQFYEVNYPEVIVSHSTNPKTHGPNKMNLTFGLNYWSSYEFPVKIELDMKRVNGLKGIAVLGHTLKSTPKKYFIETSIDRKDWKGVAKVIENKELRKTIMFTYLVPARYVRITVFSDNGNGAVALDGFGLLRGDAASPIVNFTNYSVGVKKLFDSDKATGIKIKDDGWVILTEGFGKNKILMHGKFNLPAYSANSYSLQGSNDLNTWVNIKGDWELNNKKSVIDLKNSNYRYYRINYLTGFVYELNEIELI